MSPKYTTVVDEVGCENYQIEIFYFFLLNSGHYLVLEHFIVVKPMTN